MTDHCLDILFITETWLLPHDSPIIAELNTPPYMFMHLPRNSVNHGGGQGILYNSILNVSDFHDNKFTYSESFSCSISAPRSYTFNVTLFYKPPSTIIPGFIDEFRSFATSVSANNIILGDFNIPINNKSNSPLTDVFSCCNLIQHIHAPTHVHTYMPQHMYRVTL